MSLASQSVAGSILIDAACLSTVRQQVRADDFEVAADRAIFEAACRLADAGQAADVVTIVQNARKHGADISDEYAATLMKVTPTAANATNYAATVHAEAVRRRLSEIAYGLWMPAKIKQIPQRVLSRRLCPRWKLPTQRRRLV